MPNDGETAACSVGFLEQNDTRFNHHEEEMASSSQHHPVEDHEVDPKINEGAQNESKQDIRVEAQNIEQNDERKVDTLEVESENWTSSDEEIWTNSSTDGSGAPVNLAENGEPKCGTREEESSVLLDNDQSLPQQHDVIDGNKAARENEMEVQLKELFDNASLLLETIKKLSEDKEMEASINDMEDGHTKNKTDASSHPRLTSLPLTTQSSASRPKSRRSTMDHINNTSLPRPLLSGRRRSSLSDIPVTSIAKDLKRVLSTMTSGGSVKSAESSAISDNLEGKRTSIASDAEHITNDILLEKFIQLISSIWEWHDDFQSIESAGVTSEQTHKPNEQNFETVLEQEHAPTVTTSKHDAILRHSVSMIQVIYKKLKGFLLLNPRSGLDNEDVQRMKQIQKQLDILTKVVTMFSGIDQQLSCATEQQCANYHLAFFILLELLDMTIVSLSTFSALHVNAVGEYNLNQIAHEKWELSENLLIKWKNSGFWSFYCHFFVQDHTSNVNDVSLENCSLKGNIDSSSPRLFAIPLIEQVAFQVLKECFSCKFDLSYDGRRTDIHLRDYIQVSLVDLRTACRWRPNKCGAFIPAPPHGAIRLASLLKNGSVVGRDEIFERLSTHLGHIAGTEVANVVNEKKYANDENSAKNVDASSSLAILYSAVNDLDEVEGFHDVVQGDISYSRDREIEAGRLKCDCGLYGVGKSTILSSFVSRENVRRQFSGGIAWIELRINSWGKSALKYISYCNYLQSICLQLDDGLVPEVPTFYRFVSQPDDEQSTKAIKEKHKMRNAMQRMEKYLQRRKIQGRLQGEKILIILDNLFDPDDLQWFQFKLDGCDGVHILATTQNRSLSRLYQDSIEVGLLHPHDAMQLLLRESEISESESDFSLTDANSIASSCYYHPLIIASVGRWINIELKRGASASSIFPAVAASLLRMRDCNVPLLFQVLDASLISLQNDDVSRITKLCLAAMVIIIQPSGCFDNVYLKTSVTLIKNFWSSIFLNEDCGEILNDIFSSEVDSGKDHFDFVLESLELCGIVELRCKSNEAASVPENSLSFKYEMFRMYGLYLAKGTKDVEPIAADSRFFWNQALAEQYSFRDFDFYEEYVVCMLPTHMLRAQLIDKMEKTLCNETFIRRRLSSFGCHQGSLLHVWDCKALRAAMSSNSDDEIERDRTDQVIIDIFEKTTAVFGQVMSSGEDESLILEVVQAMLEIGVALSEMGLLGKTFLYFRTSREILKCSEVSDGKHELAAATKYGLAIIHIRADRHKKAMTYLEQALQLWITHLGKENEFVAQCYYHMGEIHTRFGYYKKALDCYERALFIRKKDEDTPGVGRTLAKLGHVYHKNGQLDDALQCYNEAIEKNDQASQPCFDLAVIWNKIGNIHTLKGSYEEAMSCFMKSLEIGGRTLDDNDLDVADTLHNIAILCHFRQEYDDSLQCFNQAIAIYKNLLGASHFKVGDALYSMGSLYVDMKEYRDAQQALENALRIRKLSLHANHVAVADTLHLLGLVLVNLGDRQNAFPCFKEALRIRKHVLGSSNELVADSLNTLGVFFKEINEYGKAVGYTLRELKLRKKQFGDDSMEVAEIYHFLGILECLRNNYEASICYFQESLRLKKDLVGNNHLSVAKTLAELGRVHAEKGDYDEAISFLQVCLGIRELDIGDSEMVIGDTFQLMGKIHAQFKQFEEALRCFEQALVIRRNDDAASAETLHLMGCVFYEMDLEDKALESFQQSVGLQKSSFSDDSLDAYAKIGNIFAHRSLYDKSLESFERYIEICDKKFGTNLEDCPDPLQKADILHKMAVIHNMNGYSETAIDCELQALDIYRKNVDIGDIRIADSLHNVGSFLSISGRPKDSLEYYEEAYRLKKKILGRNHEDVATTLYNAASSQNVIGNHPKALKCLKEALEIRQNTLGEYHEKVTATLEKIAAVCREMGDISQAITTYEEILPALIEEVGTQDLRVASVLYSLGNLEDDLGNYESAMRYFTDSLKIRRTANMQEEVAACLSSMAFVQSNMKNDEAALKYLSEALEIRKHELGEDHELVSDTHNNLAYFCCSLGEREDARFHLWEALRIRKKCGAHQKVADTLNNLGNVHKDMFEYDLAIECYQEALRVRENSKIEGAADTYFNLGDLFVLKGDLDSATECYEESLKIRCATLGNDHLKVADGHLNMVEVHLKRKEYSMALLRLEEVLRIKRHNFGSCHEDIANTLFSMGIVHKAMKNAQAASEMFDEAYSVFLAAGCSQDHPQVMKLAKLRSRKGDNRKLWSSTGVG